MKRMTKSGLLTITLTVLFIIAITAVASATTIYVPDDYDYIQEAVSDAKAGDTIIVRDGTYTENVNVNVKNLTIQSDNGSAVTIVKYSYDHVFEVTADYVNISGFTVRGAPYYKAGIYLKSGTDHCNISNNNVSDNWYGIYLKDSSNNWLTNNTANSNSDGIYLEDSSNNWLTNNTANSNNGGGILLEDSGNNNLKNNTMSGNTKNFGFSCESLPHYIQDIDTSNKVDGRPIYYWVNQHNKPVPSDAGFVGIVSSTDITVRDLTLTKNGERVLFVDTQNSRIENVTVTNNDDDGIYLKDSNNNILTNNTANSNSQYGIHLDCSSNNILTNNTANSNSNGICLLGSVYVDCSSNNILTNNTANSNKYDGIMLWHSSNNLLMNNTANSNKYDGICLTAWSDYNKLINNTANSNSQYGIRLDGSGDSTLTNNTMSGNTYNFGVFCYCKDIQNIDTGNKVDGKPIYFWVNQHDKEVPSDAGFVGIMSSTNITIRDLRLTKNGEGVLLADTQNSRIENVTVSNNEIGIYLDCSSNNNLTSNTVNSNNNDGIRLWSSSNNNTLTNNNANSNTDVGIYLSSSSNNKLTSNTVNSNNEIGICLSSSSDYNTLTNNDANSNNGDGICLAYSDNNRLTNNTANTNTDNGIYLRYSSSNTIYNNYFNNTNNACDNGNNIWNVTKTVGTNIIGGPYLGGNYWSDYAGEDSDGDGLGDTPYNIPGNSNNDYLPLVPGVFVPVLSMEKSDNPDPVPPGGTLNYAIAVNNTGTATATNVTVTETYDVNVNFVGAVPPPSQGNDTWIFPALNVSETKWVNISVTVNSSVLNGTVLRNIVNVSCDEGVTDTDTENTTVFVAPALPDLVITEKWLCWPDNCTICYNVMNRGNEVAPAYHYTTLYVDRVEVAHDHVPVDLAPGESYIGCFGDYTWTYTPPSDNITVCADNNETLDELDETNNCLANIWMCGDVNCDGKVTMSDVRKVFSRYLNPNYPLVLPWAADVNCDGKVTMSDVRKVFSRYLDPGYDLNCCCEGNG